MPFGQKVTSTYTYEYVGGCRENLYRFPADPSKLHNHIMIKGNQQCILKNKGIVLSLSDRLYGRGWYWKNVETASLPFMPYEGEMDFWIREIEDTRAICRYLCFETWNFVTRNTALKQLNDIREFHRNFEGINEDLFRLLEIIKRIWALLMKKTELSSSKYTDRQLMLIDPLSSCYFLQAGQLLLNLADIYGSNKIRLVGTPNPQRAHEKLEIFCDDLFKVGCILVTKCADNTPGTEDQLDKGVNEVQMSIQKRIQNPPFINTQDLNFACTRVLRGSASEFPYLPLKPYTDLPTILNNMKVFQVYIRDKLTNLNSSSLEALIHGLVISANALILYEINVMQALIGHRFCRDYTAKKRILENRCVDEEELVPVVCLMDNKIRENRTRWFETTESLRNENLQAAREVLLNIERSAGDVWPSLQMAVILQYRFRCIKFLTRLMNRVIEVLSDPTKFEMTDPFEAICVEQQRYVETMVDTRRGVLDFPPPELPPVDIPIHIKDGRLTTGINDMDRYLQLLNRRVEPIFHSFH